MACCTGDKIPYEELFPEELKGLRKNLTSYIGGNVGKGAKAYTGPMAAPVNDASTYALNMVLGMMNQGGFRPQPGIPYTGGQQGTPYNPYTPVPPGIPERPNPRDPRERRKYDPYDQSTWLA